MRTLGILAVAAIIALVLLNASLFTVAQTEQVLITQLGQPVKVITDPGLHAKLPLIQSTIAFDKRLLDLDVPSEEVILGDQRRLIVDSFARFRIVKPLETFQAVGATEDALRARLAAVVSGSLRRVLGQERLLDVLSAARDRIMGRIRTEVNTEMRGFGIDVEDVRIRRADLPEENTEAILSRMQSERERVARQARAEGAEASARIRAEAERERTVLLAEARGTAERLRGEGERQAAMIYAAAFQKNPQFYAVWRTLEAYRNGFGAGLSRLILSNDDEFLRLLRALPPSAPPAAEKPPSDQHAR